MTSLRRCMLKSHSKTPSWNKYSLASLFLYAQENKKKCAINSCYNSFNYLHNWMAENAQRNIISICKLECFFWNGRVCLISFQSSFDKLSVVKKQVIALPDEIIGSAQHRSWCTQKVIHCYFFLGMDVSQCNY